MVEEAFSGDGETLAHCVEALRLLKAALAELDRWDADSIIGARCQHVIDDLEAVIEGDSA